MEEGFNNFNTEFARYIVIALAAPFWIPFIRKVWGEVENALREEGGVFGRSPTPAQLEEIRRQKPTEEDPLVNEPFDRGFAHTAKKPGAKSTQAAGSAGPAAAAPRRPGFRS